MKETGIGASIHNKFVVEVIDAKSGKLKQKAQAQNIVCDAAFTRLLNNQTYAGYLHYGSGSGTPSVTDTSLFTYRGCKQTTDGAITYDRTNSVLSCTNSIRLDTTEANGITITEVGIGYGNSAGNLSTHAMLQDMNGNPISITKTDTDIINIYATLYAHIIQDFNEGCYYNPGTYSYLAPGNNWYVYTDDSAPFFLGRSTLAAGFLSGAGSVSTREGQISSGSTRSVDAANKRMTFTMTRMLASAGNVHGLFGFKVGSAFYMVKGSKSFGSFPITNESVGVGDGTTTRFKTKFSFPYNAKVYVNGVEQTTGVLVKKLPSTVGSSGSTIQSHAIVLDINSTDSVHIRTTRASDTSKIATWKGNNDTTPFIIYNPLYDEGEGLNLEGPSSSKQMYWSNDCENWTQITGSLTDAQKRSKYFKVVPINYSSNINYMNPPSDTHDGYNIIFDTAPANGDVITIDYTTDYIPKDEDHVLDATFTIQFSEWQDS